MPDRPDHRLAFRGAMAVPAASAGREPERVGTWIFDLDNTLYPGTCRLFDQVQVKIREFIRSHLGLDEAGALALQKRYFREHMTTLRGLMINDGIDPNAFLDFVHDIDLSGVAPDPALDRAIAALPGRKVIFTNGSVPHVERVLARVGVDAGHFDGIFDIVASDFVPKPDIGVYRRLCETFRIEPSRAVMIDDMPRNLVPAHNLGMTTVLVEEGDAFAGLDDSADAGSQSACIHHSTANLAQFLAAWLAASDNQTKTVER
ncbi:putative hydrolase of the HAD superfamily [Dongia mobilis]|uniref:Putative hydrolase of the HAD superfamily n=1 Tax=Dongia mobilis TaxID=578943 RepID=A0A4R6WYT1_9PROT|nr:pyrimidine 5'-nucleotidase [Dongia mobilis]TDQ86481.1 putative hydrolase of the HAD superfamily [Dongia mobilis]